MSEAAIQLPELARAVIDALADHIEPEGLTNTQSARFVGCSLSLWNSLNNRGLCPSPADLSERRPVWSRTELRAWLLAGAPARSRWLAMRDVAIRKIA